MNILVVHDRKEVGDEIVEVAKSHGCDRVCLVDDAVTARDCMAEDYYDLLILDLTIPNISGRGEATYQPAEALLEEVFSPGRIHTPGSILGITRDADALTRINTNIGSHLMAIIDQSDEAGWRSQLEDRLSYLRHSDKARTAAWLTKYDYDLLILSALDKELAPVGDLFELTEVTGLPGVQEFVFNDRHGKVRRGVCSAIGRAGQPSAASETQGLICQLRPKLAIMIGFCGGVPSKVELGDILFADGALDWDFGKWKPTNEVDRLYARPEPISIRNSQAHMLARRLVEAGVQRIDGVKEKMLSLSAGELLNPKIRLIPFASGSAVIGATNVLEGISSLNEAIGGVDMESYGFYYACQHSRAAKPEFICIKAVADACGHDKDDRLHAACCYASAAVARHIAAVEWEFG